MENKKPYIITTTTEALESITDCRADIKKLMPDIDEWLLENIFQIDYYIGGEDPHLALHPNFDKYTIHAYSASMDDRKLIKEDLQSRLPQPVLDFLEGPHNRFNTERSQVFGDSKTWDYTHLPSLPLLIVIENDADKALYTIKEMEAIADRVMDSYGNSDSTDTIWEDLGLGGDDDVDYAGSYVEGACQFYRLLCYTEFKDERFLKE